MGKPNNGERLDAIETALAQIAAQLGTPGGASGSGGNQEVLLYGADGKPLGAGAAAGVTVVQVPKQAPAAVAAPAVNWTPIITALIGMVGATLPTLLQRPDPVAQMAALMEVLADAQENKSETAETIAALTPLVMMMKGGGPAPANGNGGGSADGQVQAIIRAVAAAQASSHGGAG